MRHGLPLIYCVSEDVYAKLIGMVSDRESVPRMTWKEWQSPEIESVIDDYHKQKEIARVMSQAPSRSRD